VLHACVRNEMFSDGDYNSGLGQTVFIEYFASLASCLLFLNDDDDEIYI